MTPQQIRDVLTSLDCSAKLDRMKTHQLQSQLNTNNYGIRLKMYKHNIESSVISAYVD